MQRSYDVLFASSNKNKYVEVKQILHEHGIKVGFFKFTPVEIQSDALEEIASDKARQASKLVKHPLIVEDAGLFVDSLGGFPGPYSSYVLSTIGNSGILRLWPAYFQYCIPAKPFCLVDVSFSAFFYQIQLRALVYMIIL